MTTFGNVSVPRHGRQSPSALHPPTISFNDLEFFIEIWCEGRLLFSEVVPGSVLLPEPRFTVPSSQAQTVSVSVLVGWKDSNKVARIIERPMFEYIDKSSSRVAYDYIDFSPGYPFLSGIRAWISLLFTEDENSSTVFVFGIQMDFCDVANSKDEVLWLMDILDWK